MPLSYPMLNGVRFDFSSVDVRVNGTTLLVAVKSLNYDDGLTPGEVRGNKPSVGGRTRGKYEANASMELYKSEAEELLKALGSVPGIGGSGYMEISFQLIATHSEPTTPDLTTVDTLNGCRIKKMEDSKAEGEDALTTKIDLSVIQILRNGRAATSAAKSFI